MKDAFGATYYIAFALTFIAIFASLLALSLNYAKAFRIKNTIISYIENNNGYDRTLEDKIEAYVADMKYYVTNVNPGSSVDYLSNYCSQRGYCIYEYSSNNTNSNAYEYRGKYYKIVTYIQVRFPFFDLDVSIPISGETKLLSQGSRF